MRPHQTLVAIAVICLLSATAIDVVHAQAPVALIKRAENKPLPSLRSAGAAALRAPFTPRGFPFVVPNQMPKEDLRTQLSGTDAADL
ncbi:MAG TPA: hypothetical protein VMO47_06005, partial [Rhodothermales bacterium]|nr:hypothetical protein [Rhodothermales bacterium]